VNEQAAKLTRWLLAGNGALKNVAQLLTESFGPVGVVAATIDATTITAYPVDPSDEPQGREWAPVPEGWTHPLHSQLLPRSTSASHHVVVGVTSRNQVLVVNLAAAAYLGIEGDDPVLMMRSWLIQVLSKTPTANVAVNDPALAVAGAGRLTLIDDAGAAPQGTSLLFSTQHTSAPDPGQPHPFTVSSQAADAANVVLCSEAVAGIYLANRYWPVWRRMEIADQQWEQLKAVLVPASVGTVATPILERPPTSVAVERERDNELTFTPRTAGPLTSLDGTSPNQVPPLTLAPVPDRGDPATSTDDTSPGAGRVGGPVAGHQIPHESPTLLSREPLTPPASHEKKPLASGDDTSPPEVDEPAAAAVHQIPRGSLVEPPTPTDTVTPPLLIPDIPAPLAATAEDEGQASGADSSLLPGRPAEDHTKPGLYVLGPVYALGVDPDTKEPVRHSAVTRQGVRKPVKALMALATSNGVTPVEWEEKILQVTPQNRRQLRTQIRKMMGGNDPIRNDARGLLIVDMFCDWKEFNRLVGHTPESATTDALTAAVKLIRGTPFEDVPDEDYSWRSVQLLKDELIDRCSTAAAELAQRQQAAGAHAAAYQTARMGLRVYAQREDLWLVAVNSVTDTDRKALIWDLKHAIPVPTHPELRQLLAAARAS